MVTTGRGNRLTIRFIHFIADDFCFLPMAGAVVCAFEGDFDWHIEIKSKIDEGQGL